MTNSINNLYFFANSQVQQRMSGISKLVLDEKGRKLDHDAFMQKMAQLPLTTPRRDFKSKIWKYMSMLDKKESIHLILIKMVKSYLYLKMCENKIETDDRYTYNINYINDNFIGFNNNNIKSTKLEFGLLRLFEFKDFYKLKVKEAKTVSDINIPPYLRNERDDFFM